MYEKLMAAGRVVVHDIYFDVGSSDVQTESLRTLEVISAMLACHEDLHLRVEVHTDNAGSAERNDLLSAARANALVAHLVRSGVDQNRVTGVGRGSAWPVAPNDTPENRQRNRRIELVVVAAAEAGSPA